MTAALDIVLAKAGIRVTADEFLSRLSSTAEQLSPAHPEPSTYFTTQQQETLSAIGLDLSDLDDRDPDPRAGALIAQTVLNDSTYSAAEAAAVISVDTSRIRHRLAAGHLVGWKDRGGWRLPAWQFTTTGALPGLDTVLAAVPADQPPLVLAAFMTTPQADLRLGTAPSTPREWLLAGGDPTRVAELAAMLGTPV